MKLSAVRDQVLTTLRFFQYVDSFLLIFGNQFAFNRYRCADEAMLELRTNIKLAGDHPPAE